MFKDLFRAVLSDETIVKMNKKGQLIEGILSPEQIQPNSVDLTLGTSISILNYNPDEIIDPREHIKYKNFNLKDYPINPESKKYSYVLRPGDFALMASNEVLNIPNGIIAFVAGRSSVARLGIQVEQAVLIDAGFHGTITFEVCNQTAYPIVLYAGMRIAQVYFIKAQHAINPYAGLHKKSKYQSQILATGSRINNDPELKK